MNDLQRNVTLVTSPVATGRNRCSLVFLMVCLFALQIAARHRRAYYSTADPSMNATSTAPARTAAERTVFRKFPALLM